MCSNYKYFRRQDIQAEINEKNLIAARNTIPNRRWSRISVHKNKNSNIINNALKTHCKIKNESSQASQRCQSFNENRSASLSTLSTIQLNDHKCNERLFKCTKYIQSYKPLLRKWRPADTTIRRSVGSKSCQTKKKSLMYSTQITSSINTKYVITSNKKWFQKCILKQNPKNSSNGLQINTLVSKATSYVLPTFLRLLGRFVLEFCRSSPFFIVALIICLILHSSYAATSQTTLPSKPTSSVMPSETFVVPQVANNSSTRLQGLTLAFGITENSFYTNYTTITPLVSTGDQLQSLIPKELNWEIGSQDNNENVISYINRQIILNHRHRGQHQQIGPKQSRNENESKNNINDETIVYNQRKETYNNSPQSDNFTSASSCYSCQMRERAKLDNLESIKRHILMRLHMSQLPNITDPPVVPQIILENFYKSFHTSKASAASTYNMRYPAQQDHSIGYKPSSSVKSNYDEDGNNHDEDDETINFDNKMQGDSPQRLYNILNYNSEEESYDEFYSHLHSVFIFPTTTRLRHNHKPEVLNFNLHCDASNIARAFLHVYIRGHSWMRDRHPELLEYKHSDGRTEQRREVIISVHRALRRPNSANYTHTVKLIEVKCKIPLGFGQWTEIEMKQLSMYWLANANATQSLIINGNESWMRPFIVTDSKTSNRALRIHIELMTKAPKRNKRSASLDCREGDNEVRCCRYPLRVNFKELNWTFIMAPGYFDAYFCNGNCKAGYLEQYTHTHLTTLSTSATPCCAPSKMSPLPLLYFTAHEELLMTVIPNMSVDKCSCF
uniref:TGF-beta family profile domain-containing protein n=1 Tax=Glossina austeni TaxID=7395 RepID=A0A1A9VEF5_GLOAU